MAATHGPDRKAKTHAPALRLVTSSGPGLEETVAIAEQLATRGNFEAAVQLLEGVVPSTHRSPRLALRALIVESASRFELGEVDAALDAIQRARAIAETDACSDMDRAQVFFQLGRCRLAVGSVANAISLLTLSLDLADHSLQASDAFRTRVLDWRSRCYQRRRDWQAARADVERALELATSLGDDAVSARIYFQASIVAEREQEWLLARFYAENAQGLLAALGDRIGEGKVLNNLGGIHFLLGKVDRAIACLLEAAEIAVEHKIEVDAGYALSSLAQVRLLSGDAKGAERDARKALGLLSGRADHAGEIGNAELVRARALLELGRFAKADAACVLAERALLGYGSASHMAAVWVTRGDVARGAGDVDKAADLYRQAAEALQDVNF